MVEIVFLGTEWFWTYYDKTSPKNKLESLLSYCGTQWAQEIDENNGDYPFTPYIESGSSKLVVPESALPDTDSTLKERRTAVDNWLANNSGMNWADGFVVADHYGFDDNTYGWSYGAGAGAAGGNYGITALVDCSWEDHSDLPPAYNDVKSEGLAFHEMLHLFSGNHTKANTESNGDASVMWDWNDVDCTDSGPGSLKEGYVSSCNQNRIHNY